MGQRQAVQVVRGSVMAAKKRVNRQEAIQLGLPWYTTGTVIDGREFHGYRENVRGSITVIWQSIGYKDKNYTHTEKRTRKNREFTSRVKRMYGCANCGYKSHPAALHFDHINRKEKQGVVSNLVNGTRAKLKDEMRKCRILCANCHAIKTYEEKEHT